MQQGQLAVELAQILFENWEIDEQDQAQSASTYSKYILGELGRQDISSEAYNLVATSAIKLIRSWDFDGGKVAELCTVAGETLFASRGAENFYLASKYLARGTDMQTFANVINKASNVEPTPNPLCLSSLPPLLKESSFLKTCWNAPILAQLDFAWLGL